LLINSLKSTFNFLKTHAQVISKASGVLLIIMGLLLMSGRLI
jgi:cytochrome c biogenesis protein CcdA